MRSALGRHLGVEVRCLIIGLAVLLPRGLRRVVLAFFVLFDILRRSNWTTPTSLLQAAEAENCHPRYSVKVFRGTGYRIDIIIERLVKGNVHHAEMACFRRRRCVVAASGLHCKMGTE